MALFRTPHKGGPVKRDTALIARLADTGLGQNEVTMLAIEQICWLAEAMRGKKKLVSRAEASYKSHKSGKAWESNPPTPALRRRPPILKTGAATGRHPPKLHEKRYLVVDIYSSAI
ncbi:MAG: hypothetical protein R2932_13670 [Caldilineaceae bacterium]